MFRIGVDVGGTFTDFTVLDERDSQIRFFKVPSTPREPSEAIEDGLRQMIAAFGLAAADISYLGHGTTVATNIVIERRGARTGLLTTKGFRDVLELGRRTRPRPYGLTGWFDVKPEHFREYRIRVITEKLEQMPELIDRLYKKLG